MTIALPCCRGRWLGGSPPCSSCTVPCRPCSGKRPCQSPSGRTPLSPTPATAARAPASTAWGLQRTRPVSQGFPKPGQPLSVFLPPSFPFSLSVSLLSNLPFPFPHSPSSSFLSLPHPTCSLESGFPPRWSSQNCIWSRASGAA